MIVEPAVVAYNLEVKADVVADIANIAEFGKASDTQASSVEADVCHSFAVSYYELSRCHNMDYCITVT